MISEVLEKESTEQRILLEFIDACIPPRLRPMVEWAEDEIEAARAVLGDDVPTIGFYSNAEISPMGPLLKGELQNQSLMITTFKEI